MFLFSHGDIYIYFNTWIYEFLRNWSEKRNAHTQIRCGKNVGIRAKYGQHFISNIAFVIYLPFILLQFTNIARFFY